MHAGLLQDHALITCLDNFSSSQKQAQPLASTLGQILIVVKDAIQEVCKAISFMVT